MTGQAGDVTSNPIGVRAATERDDSSAAAIAAAGDAATPPWYLAHVRAAGRLLVAERDGTVVGFGGMVPAAGVAMVTDLFVAPHARGAGVGSLLLGHLLDGWPARMTCSSQHPAALPAYARHGMQPRGLVHYYRGRAVGGGPPLQPAPWLHTRAELAAMWAARGAVVTADCIVQVADDGAVAIHRAVGADGAAGVASVRRALSAFSPSTAVTLCVPDWQPVGEWLLSNRFDRVDHDLWCASSGVQPDPTLVVTHPGLW